MTPIISIVMPVYQVEDYIANSIRSVVNQTFSSFEVCCPHCDSSDEQWKSSMIDWVWQPFNEHISCHEEVL